jgi:glycosyltransferase involved in cell wall biosynthesis
MSSSTQGPAPILFVHEGLDWIRGSERCMLDLVERLDRTRYRPIVWCNTPTLADAARAVGADVHLARTTPEVPGAFPVDRGLARVARGLIARHGVRLIHANTLDPLPALVVAARSARIPIANHLHLIPTEAERRWTLAHQVTLAVGVSRASVAGLLEDGMPPERTTVIYNGVDGERLARGSATGLRAELGIPTEATVAAIVASLIARKGIDVALDAVGEAVAAGRDLHLLVCGDGPDDEALRRRAADRGLAGRAHFLGQRADVGPILRDASDLLVSAARLEAFPLNILEAGECGVPVVVSDIAPHVEAVEDGVTGLVVRTDDTAAFAAAVIRLADDPGLRHRLGAAAQARVRTRFSFTRWLADFDAAYARLLATPASDHGWVRGSTWPPVYTAWLRNAVVRRAGRLTHAALGKTRLARS